jgi:hypothetical protein
MEIVLTGVFTLLGVVVGAILDQRRQVATDKRSDQRLQADRLLQARLRQIEDTQRYVNGMLEYVSSVGLLGKANAGPVPNLGDYPKVTMSLLGESDVVMAFARYLEAEAPRIAADGPRWQQDDRDRFLAIGVTVSRALREQEERVLSGQAPLVAPPDEQERRMRELTGRQTTTP